MSAIRSYHNCIFAILSITLFCCRTEASTLALDLVLESPYHGYFPEGVVQMPGSGTILTLPAQSRDTANSPNAAGMVINLEGVTMIEFNLLAPGGSTFHVSPSGVNYTLGYAISLQGWSLEGVSSGATSGLLGVSSAPPPWFFDSVSDDPNGALLLGASQASNISYAFTGMRITFMVPAQLANGEVVMDSAKIMLSSRDLYGTIDPGQTMSLIPIPEISPFVFVVFSGLLMLRRNRSSP